MLELGLCVTVNSDDPAQRFPARGFISLTDDEVAQFKALADADGNVPGDAVKEISRANGTSEQTTYVQAFDRLPLCRAATPDLNCAGSVLNPPPPEAPTSNLRTPRTARSAWTTFRAGPASGADDRAGRGPGGWPDAGRSSRRRQSNIKSLTFDPSPADVAAFHDFSNLQIADYVWQEASDRPGRFDSCAERVRNDRRTGRRPIILITRRSPVGALGAEASWSSTPRRPHGGGCATTAASLPAPGASSAAPAAGGFGGGDCVHPSNAKFATTARYGKSP
jgi:hypothetical protein